MYSYWNSESFSATDCETWEAKVELILSALLAKAAAHCLPHKCVSPLESWPILIFLFAFMSQVHYFVIIIN